MNSYPRLFLTLIPWSILSALPLGLRRDVLYLWATFRLRRKPHKIMAWVALLGLVCWLVSWSGSQWIVPKLEQWAGLIESPHLRELCRRVSGAFFSSLNLLSCCSIVVVWITLRRLAAMGHIESLLLTPNRIRPSALFYAVASRYTPLVLVALLVEFLHPIRSPFKRDFPFVRYEQYEAMLMRDNWTTAPVILQWGIIWSAAHLIAVALFCLANLFMDLALAYWLFSRIRLTFSALGLAVAIVGLVSPFLLMELLYRIWHAQRELLPEVQRIVEQYGAGAPLPDITRVSADHILTTVHYGTAALGSGLIAWALLAELNLRWLRIQTSPDRDPILLRAPSIQ